MSGRLPHSPSRTGETGQVREAPVPLVEVASQQQSKLEGNRLSWGNLCEVASLAGLSDEDQIRYPDPGETSRDARPGETVVSYDHFKAGLRWPLPEPMIELCRFFSVSPGQLTPNAWRYWVAFYVHCDREGIAYSLGLFRHLFLLRKSVGQTGEAGFAPRGKRVFSGRIIKKADWKRKWFYLGHPSSYPAWNDTPADKGKGGITTEEKALG